MPPGLNKSNHAGLATNDGIKDYISDSNTSTGICSWKRPIPPDMAKMKLCLVICSILNSEKMIILRIYNY